MSARYHAVVAGITSSPDRKRFKVIMGNYPFHNLIFLFSFPLKTRSQKNNRGVVNNLRYLIRLQAAASSRVEVVMGSPCIALSNASDSKPVNLLRVKSIQII
ncbi:MAG: hypothetical protein A4E62_02218 [Syntrophorhabdus sp. PtaU1.Bin002]|nr:MAG: hypothetical protein A4E62_02218 [Syntrophorhabdus sp. PtaU1.Bin002]